jgi:hypothetical protein
LEFCESNREKCLGKPEPKDDTDNNASEKKHRAQGQSTPAPRPVQDQHHQVEQKNYQQDEATRKTNEHADKQQTHY